MGLPRRRDVMAWFLMASITWSAEGLPSTRSHDSKAFQLASSHPAFTAMVTNDTGSTDTEPPETAPTPTADITSETPKTDPSSTTESLTTTIPTTTSTTTITTTSPTTTTITTFTTTVDGGDVSEPKLVAILLGVLVPVAAIAFAAVIYVCFFKRRPKLAHKVSTRNRGRRRLSYHPISIIEFNSQYNRRLREGDIDHEFELLQEYSAKLYEEKSRSIGQLEINKPRNRFVDIVPYDDTLVTLNVESGLPPSRYVNASYINGFTRQDLYIATQGPKRNTVVDFWNMILEQNSSVIVCLTNLIEGGRVKCFQYWPNVGEMLHFDELTLMTLDEVHTNNGECVIRKIEITKDDDTPGKVIRQFHHTSWPDHGVPNTPKTLLDLCISLNGIAAAPSTSSNDNRDSLDEPDSPIVMHCSAGVGRTGTLLAVSFIIRDIVEKGADEVDVALVVKHLREQRPKMVQSIDQYQFIYTCVSQFINDRASKRLSLSDAAHRKASSQYSASTASGGHVNRAMDVCAMDSV